MEIIRPGTQIDFIRYRNVAALGSLVLILAGLALAAVRGPNLGIDFSGGSLVHVRLGKPTTTQDVRRTLQGAGVAGASIQQVQGESEFLIRLPLQSEDPDALAESVTSALAQTFGADQVEILRIEAVGPLVGRVLREKAILALSFATVMMGVYIWARFQWRFGVGAGLALFHDVLLTIAALIAWNYEFDLTVVAALLTVIGFSVNDTVIVSDRIRENMRKDRRSALAAIINRSINETLSRTVLTTGTGLFVVIALYLLGGTVIHGFAFTLLVGFMVGTYSSIYIATPVVLFFEGRRPTVGRRA
jgi:preprotein translocase subunit SecF